MPELWKFAKKFIKLENEIFYKKELKLIYNKYNPINFAQTLKNSIIILQSKEDELLTIANLKTFIAKLKCAHKLIYILNRKHDLDSSENELIKALLK